MLRQYDSRLGRWLTKDPMGQYASPYMAMGNNPVSFIDPSGGYDYLEESIIRNQKFFDRSQRDFWGEHIPGASDAYSADNSKIDMDAMINESMANYYTNKYGNSVNGFWTYATIDAPGRWVGINSNENSLPEFGIHILDLGWLGGNDESDYWKKNHVLLGSGSIEYDGKAWGQTNFVGPGPNQNPYTIDDPNNKGQFLKPLDEIDAAAQRHDDVYWKTGTGGPTGALFNKAVVTADIQLAMDAKTIMQRYEQGAIDVKTGYPISERTYTMAKIVYNTFSAIAVNKLAH